MRSSTRNSDLWTLVSEALDELRGQLQIYKVDSHQSTAEEDDFLTEWPNLNNSDVDVAARHAGAQRRSLLKALGGRSEGSGLPNLRGAGRHDGPRTLRSHRRPSGSEEATMLPSGSWSTKGSCRPCN